MRAHALLGPTPVALLLTLGAGVAAAQLPKPQYVEPMAVVEQEPLTRGATVRAAVESKIGRGYHVNANPPSEDWLIATEISVSGAPGVSIERVFYPDAVEKIFEFWSTPLRVYEGDVVAGVVLQVAADAELGPHDLTLTIDYQACNDQACFAPSKVSTTVPLSVAEAGSSPRTLRSPLLQRARFADPAQ